MSKIKPFFPLAHGVPRVDDRQVISGIIFVLKNGLPWRDAPCEYGPHKTLYNRFRRGTEMGVFDKIFSYLTKVYFVIHRVLGNVGPMKTPTDCCVNIYQRKPTYRFTRKRIWTRSRSS